MAKKDFNLPKHGEIDTKNLYVGLGFRFLCLWFSKCKLTPETLSVGDQGLPVTHFAQLPEDAILLAMVLLHLNPRGP